MLDEDVEEEEADDEAAGLASEDEADDEVDGVVEDFDEAGELLDEEPRLSFR